MDTTEEIVKILARKIQLIEQNEGDMDIASWIDEDGVLITANQAKAIINALSNAEK